MNGSTRGPRHAGSLDPLEFSLVEFCQLVDFLLDIVSLVSFFPCLSGCSIFFLSLHFPFDCSCCFVFTFYSDQFFIIFLAFNGLIAISLLVSSFSHFPYFYSPLFLFPSYLFLTFGSDTHLESLPLFPFHHWIHFEMFYSPLGECVSASRLCILHLSVCLQCLHRLRQSLCFVFFFFFVPKLAFASSQKCVCFYNIFKLMSLEIPNSSITLFKCLCV